jgi:hypothetical protein
LAVKVYGACSAHADSATVLGAGHIQQVAQCPQQRHLWLRIDGSFSAIDLEYKVSHFRSSNPTSAPQSTRATSMQGGLVKMQGGRSVVQGMGEAGPGNLGEADFVVQEFLCFMPARFAGSRPG